VLSLGGGRVVHTREWPGHGRPIVLLPGMFDSAPGWDDLARASDRPCIAIDLAGFGRSSPPTRPRLSAYADDVVQVLRTAGVRSLTLVGHSLGGGVATAVAERMPQQVASLVLCAPVGFGRIALAEFAALPLVRQLASGLAPHVLANPFLLSLVYADFVTTGATPTEELRSRLAAGADHVTPGFRAAVEAVAVAGRSARAFHRRSVRYRGPVTAVWGDRDALVPLSHRRGLMAAFPQARVQVWTGMGHHPQRERPKRLAELVAAASSRPHERSEDCHRMVMDTHTNGAYRVPVRPQPRLSMGLG
jgi:pimeloyl-ACP methyl ester carboxylesterase